MFLITLNYNAALKKRISAVVFIYAFLFINDILLVIVTGHVINSIVESLEYSAYLALPLLGLLLYLEALLAQNFKNIRKSNPVSSMFWISSIVIPVSSVFILIAVSFSTNSKIIIITSIIVMFLINVLTFYLHDSLSAAYADKLKLKLYEQEREYYYNQCELMGASVDEINSYRHDANNHLSAVRDFIKCSQYDGALDYIENLVGEVNSHISYSDTGNIAFDSIINYKFRKANENDIALQVKVSVPQKLKIDMIDIVTIIGNLLDNAIEAVLKVNDKKITLNVVYSKGKILIFIENTYNGIVKRNENGEIISVKAVKLVKEGVKHGYGLKNINKSIDKYNGYLEINHTESLFSADVLLYVQPE